MQQFKTLIISALVLAFIGGVGLGTWVGSLRAAAPAPPRSLERRMADWNARYDLTPTQQRRIRQVLASYDARRARIQSELDAEHWQRGNRLLEESRKEIDRILAETPTATPGIGG